MIFWYLQGATKSQTSLRKSHSQFSIDGSGMSNITAFKLNGLILCPSTYATTWKKALLYISLYKQTNKQIYSVV